MSRQSGPGPHKLNLLQIRSIRRRFSDFIDLITSSLVISSMQSPE